MYEAQGPEHFRGALRSEKVAAFFFLVLGEREFVVYYFRKFFKLTFQHYYDVLVSFKYTFQTVIYSSHLCFIKKMDYVFVNDFCGNILKD